MNEENSLQPQTTNQNSSTEIVQDTQQSVEETKQAEIDSKIESLAEFEKPKVDVGKVKTDEKKNLINNKGQVVAKSGAERRIFNKMQTENATLKTENDKLKSDNDKFIKEFIPKFQEDYNKIVKENQSFGNIKQVCEQNGINNEQMLIGVNFIKEYMSNPVSTVKKMLTDLENRGYDINNLDGEVNDKKRIEDIIEERIKPFKEEREKRLQYEQRRTEMQKQVQEFYNNYEHSQIHTNEIVQLGKKIGGDYVTAYYKLREYYIKNGLDFGKRLSEQNNNIKTVRNVTGLPNVSRTAMANLKNVKQIQNDNDFIADKRHRDIIKELME